MADAGCALLATAAGAASPFGPSWSVPVLVLPPLVWVTALLATGCYDRSGIKDKRDEFRRILGAAGLVLAGVAVVAWGWEVDVPRCFVALTLPLAALLTLAAREIRRRVSSHAPAAGADTVLLIGDRSAAELLHDQFVRRAAGSHRVVGYCLPTPGGVASPPAGLPVLGGLTDVAEIVRRFDVDTVVVLPSAGMDGAALQRLVEQVDAAGKDLLIASALADIIGSRRARIRSVAGLRLLQVRPAHPLGATRSGRATWNRVLAGVLIVLVAPVLVAVAVALALDSRGPVLVREPRVGPDGRTFSALRFRAEVSGSAGDLTRVGGLLRRRCLDELPQLVNVLRGDLPLPPLSLLRSRDRCGADA